MATTGAVFPQLRGAPAFSFFFCSCAAETGESGLVARLRHRTTVMPRRDDQVGLQVPMHFLYFILFWSYMRRDEAASVTDPVRR